MSSLPTQQNIFALEGAQSSNAIANQQESDVVKQLMFKIHQGEQNQMILLAKLEKLENDKSNENTADEQEKLSTSLTKIAILEKNVQYHENVNRDLQSAQAQLAQGMQKTHEKK